MTLQNLRILLVRHARRGTWRSTARSSGALRQGFAKVSSPRRSSVVVPLEAGALRIFARSQSRCEGSVQTLGFSKLARANFRYIFQIWCESTYFEESCVALRGSLDEHTARKHLCVSVGKVPIAKGDRPVWHATEWKAGEANGPSRRQRCTSPALRAPRTSAAGRLEPNSPQQ